MLISGFIGARLKSIISTIIIAPVSIALFGNAVAVSLNGMPWLTWAITVAGVAVSFNSIAIQSRAIRDDEVL